MKWGIIVLVILLSVKGTAQPYRLVCDDVSIPELDTQLRIHVEEWKEGEYKKLRRNTRYTLSGNVVGGKDVVHFTRAQLYTQNGSFDIDLLIDGKHVPLSLQLPVLKDIRYNLFTDSIKPILNYYLNVEGVFTNGKIYPLDASFISVTANEGRMSGLEWVPPAHISFEKVSFMATCIFAPGLKKTITLYLKKYKDPRDAEGYKEKN